MQTPSSAPSTSRFTFQPERITDDLYCLPLPLLDGSPVNCFVVVAPDGIRLIDGGLDSDACRASLEAQLRLLGYQLTDVRAVLVTHGHNDHIGAAPTMADTGGEILAHRREPALPIQSMFDDAWLRRHGLPDYPPYDGPPFSKSVTATRQLDDGDVLRWGDLELEVLWCPGHTPGLVCLLERRRKLLFTTDHVMRRAPSPITLRADDEQANPLGEYLASVRKLRGLPVDTVLPGHGRPFGDLDGRLSQIETHAQQRLARLRAFMARGPATAYDVALLEQAGRTPSWSRESGVVARFALAGTLAQLRYLERLGAVECQTQTNGEFRFVSAT